MVVDNYVDPSGTYRFSKANARARVDTLKAKMNYLPVGPDISYEPENTDNGVFEQLDAMPATQALYLKCVNGYSATSSGTFTPFVV